MGNIGIAALAGIFVPFLVSFLKNTSWSAKVKQGVAIGTSAVVALGITALDNGVNLSDWKVLLANVTVVFSVAQVVYQQYFGGTALNARLENAGVGAK
jgi:hypothetical protein